jgi:tetratricopeptide (TPR) repeat protein
MKKRNKPPNAKNDAPPPEPRGQSRRLWIAVALVAAIAAFAWFVLPRTKTLTRSVVTGPVSAVPGDKSIFRLSSAAGKTGFEDFAGAEACAKCHQKEYNVWKNSTHGRAGGSPHDTKVIARFDGKPLQFADGTVTPTLNVNREPVFIVETPGEPKMEIKPDAIVGGGQMYGGGTQSFLQKFDDGTVRFLPFDFIRGEDRWFVQLRRDMTWVPVARDVSLRTDLANWPPRRILGTLTEFSNCQNCHGSQIVVRYDDQTRKYETRFQSLNINCESCHGPGKRHIEIVSRPGYERLEDIGMKPLATLTKDESLNVCFQCHATKEVLREDPYLPGDPLEAFFSLKLPQFENTYTADGRVRAFGYQGNHLYSDCYRNGSMTCVDCHDPHSQNYRDVFGKPLAGRFDNRQCTSCHASKAGSPERHTHHKPDSAGNLCTSCHMPYLQHRGVGMHLQFARSDHGIPIPRPAFDEKLGIENACQKCHRDKDTAWQEARVREWYGDLKPHPTAIANLLQAVDATDRTAAAMLLLSATNHSIAQASGLIEFLKRFVQPNMQSPAVADRLKVLAQNTDIDVAALALAALDIGYATQPDAASVCEKALRAQTASSEAIRDRWALAAAYRGDAYAGDTANAIFCFNRSLAVKPASVVTLSHLALAHLNAGDVQPAVEALQKAIALQPHKATLHFQLALIQYRRGQIGEAIRELEEGLKYAPDDPAARRMLEQLRR